MRTIKLTRAIAVAAVLSAGISIGVAAPLVAPRVFPGLISKPPTLPDTKDAPKKDRIDHPGEKAQKDAHADDEGLVRLSDEKISANKIGVEKIGPGVLTRTMEVPGTIVPDPDRVAKVPANVVGIVTQLKKRLGDRVEKNEIVATLDSREVADARSEYIAARVSLRLQGTLLDRSKALYQKQIMAEQAFLREQNAFDQADLRVTLARQKLTSLHPDEDFEALERQSVPNLRSYDLHAPMTGQVMERQVNLGTPVGGEGQVKELYTIIDSSRVWVDLAVATSDLARIAAGSSFTLTAGEQKAVGKIVFVSPQLDKDTRAARVIGELDNQDDAWRPGSFITAQIATHMQPVDLLVPAGAVLTTGGESIVFVRTTEGFKKRTVQLGRTGDGAVEVVSGLERGESVAVSNTFLLKAELGKAEAEHHD